jgi:hypothetical protein
MTTNDSKSLEKKNTSVKSNDLADRIIEDAKVPETAETNLEKNLQINLTEENNQKTKETILSLVGSYSHKDGKTTDAEWLSEEFDKFPSIWKNEEERLETARTIVEAVNRYEAEKQKLADYRKKGISSESYLKTAIETGAKAQGIIDFGKYAAEIDIPLNQVNSDNITTLYNMNDVVNQQQSHASFIVEKHHVTTFNLDAAAKGRNCQAKILSSANSHNSVDVVITDENGRIVRKYLAKSGSDAKTTNDLFEKGDYQGQTKLVPKGQSNEIEGSTEFIEYDGIKSEHLSIQQAKEKLLKIQEAQEAKQYEWNKVNGKAIAKNIGQKAFMAALLAVGFQGTSIIGRRIWNTVTNKKNQTIAEDAKVFVESAIKSGITAGLTVAVTGAIVTAIKSGWLGEILKATPVSFISNAVCNGTDIAKITYSYANGQITCQEALNKVGDTTISFIGSLALGAKGVTVGAIVGSVFGPIGTIIGGIAGGLVGSIAGSAIGNSAWDSTITLYKSMSSRLKSNPGDIDIREGEAIYNSAVN